MHVSMVLQTCVLLLHQHLGCMKVDFFHQWEVMSPIVVHYLSSHGLVLQLSLIHHVDPEI